MWEQAERYFGNELTIHLWYGLWTFIVVLAVGFVAKHLLNTVIRKIVAKTETDLDDKIFDIIVPRIKWITIIVGLYLSTEELSKAVIETNKTGQRLIGYGEGVIYICFVLFFSIVLIKLFDTMVMHAMEKHAKRKSTVVDKALFPILNRLIMILILCIAGVTMLGHFGVNVSSLLVFLGGSSVALALAAQETLANMIAGFVIMIDRPFRMGDHIKLPSGEIADVTEIGLRSTKLLDADNNVIISPNTELTKAKIINFTYPSSDIRVVVSMQVAYGIPLDQARSIMLNAAIAHPQVFKDPAPTVSVVASTDSSVTLDLNARTYDWKKKFAVETSLREQIYNEFIRNNIRPAIPQHIIYMTPEDRHGNS
jgi:small-conductance mechanosensitive channel